MMKIIIKGDKNEKKQLILFIFILSIVACKETKTLQQEFDDYIDREDFEGIKKLKGRYFAYEDMRIFNELISTYFVFLGENFNTKKLYKTPSLNIYTNKNKPNLSVVYVAYGVGPKEKTKNFKGLNTELAEMALFKCEEGYRNLIFSVCKYDKNGKIVLSNDVYCVRKAKIYDDGSLENIAVWNKKITPDYVIEVKTPDEFIISNGSESEYFFYYDENHY